MENAMNTCVIVFKQQSKQFAQSVTHFDPRNWHVHPPHAICKSCINGTAHATCTLEQSDEAFDFWFVLHIITIRVFKIEREFAFETCIIHLVLSRTSLELFLRFSVYRGEIDCHVEHQSFCSNFSAPRYKCHWYAWLINMQGNSWSCTKRLIVSFREKHNVFWKASNDLCSYSMKRSWKNLFCNVVEI